MDSLRKNFLNSLILILQTRYQQVKNTILVVLNVIVLVKTVISFTTNIRISDLVIIIRVKALAILLTIQGIIYASVGASMSSYREVRQDLQDEKK